MLRILFWGGVLFLAWRAYWKYFSRLIPLSDIKEYALFCGVAVVLLVIYRKVTKQPIIW